MARRAWLASLLVLALAGLALAGPRVRITLRDGTVLEGELVDYGARRYEVTTGGGERRQVAEGEVRTVAFLGEARPSAAQALGRALRAEGALEALVGERHLHVREAGFRPRELLDDDARLDSRVDEALLRLQVERAEGGVRLRLDALPLDSGTELRSLGLGALPAALEAEVGLDGVVRSLRHVGPGGASAVAPTADADTLPEVVLVLLLAPLVEHGVPEALAVRVQRLDGLDAAASTLEVLPTDRAARVREVRLTPPPASGAPTLDLRIGLRGADRGRLLGWRARTVNPGASAAALDVEVDRVAPSAWEELRGSTDAPELAAGPAAGAPGPLGELLAAAEGAGRVDALLAALEPEPLLRWAVEGRIPRGARVRARRELGGLRLDVAASAPGRDGLFEVACRVTAAGGLRWLRVREGSRSDGLFAELTASASGLRGRARASQSAPWRAVALDAAAVPASFAALVAGRLGALPPGLEVTDELSLASPLGVDLRPAPAADVAPTTTAALALLGEEWRARRDADDPGRAGAIAALRRVAAAQAARAARGEPPATSLAELGDAAPARLATHQLVVVGRGGGWAAFARSLDAGDLLGLGPDGVLRAESAYKARSVAPGADLLEALKPTR